jgi:hypothetical protein
MFFEEPRTDGLLRGPRNERKELMTALGDAPWNLETFLAFHLGLVEFTRLSKGRAKLGIKVARDGPDVISR